MKSLGQLEQHAFYILFIAAILVLFWYSIWNIMDELKETAKDRWGVTAHQFSCLVLASVVGLIALFPETLEKF